ncbi:MAG TPA: hypothetical protein VGJ26_22415, partial [Pirellulales bacterium]
MSSHTPSSGSPSSGGASSDGPTPVRAAASASVDRPIAAPPIHEASPASPAKPAAGSAPPAGRSWLVRAAIGGIVLAAALFFGAPRINRMLNTV